ncbi:aminotransferase class III-fold pyridoxal phosphate-dependent enzyme [Streptomyces sp. SID7803]|nr:aminotransferase class III-fold pyridoxal phosphate-dependent enzyme [Streptomyces sp. SID7803]
MLETLRRYEPATMHTQHPVVWDRASGSRVFAQDGRSWLDWTSGILTANAGHARAEVVTAITAQAQQGLLHAYMFPTRVRPHGEGVGRALRLCAGGSLHDRCRSGRGRLKISSRHAIARRGPRRNRSVVVTFDGSFHGRTLGGPSSQAGFQLSGTGRRPWTRSSFTCPSQRMARRGTRRSSRMRCRKSGGRAPKTSPV